MHVEITGHHLTVTPALNDYIREKITRLKRHFDQVLDIHFIMKVENQYNTVEGSLRMSGNHIFADAKDKDGNMYAAIDALTDKLDRQIIKHKEKTKSHHRAEGSRRNMQFVE